MFFELFLQLAICAYLSEVDKRTKNNLYQKHGALVHSASEGLFNGLEFSRYVLKAQSI